MDSLFWVAITRARDQYRSLALRWKHWLDQCGSRLVTTEPVLWEWLNTLSDPSNRKSAFQGYRLCHTDTRIEVVPFHAEFIQEALALYRDRADKAWSLTDCFSFVVMGKHGLTSALTFDHHFTQAGFRALLLEEPPLGDSQ